jgi:hypothetical protein
VMVDLDEEVVRVCMEYLPSWHQGAFDDARTRLLFEDARAVLEKEDRTYDACDPVWMPLLCLFSLISLRYNHLGVRFRKRFAVPCIHTLLRLQLGIYPCQ